MEVRVVLKDGTPVLDKYLPKEKINDFGNYLLPKEQQIISENWRDVFCLEIAMKENILNIYGDSSLVIDYWSKGFIKKNNVSENTYNLAMKVKIKRIF